MVFVGTLSDHTAQTYIIITKQEIAVRTGSDGLTLSKQCPVMIRPLNDRRKTSGVASQTNHIRNLKIDVRKVMTENFIDSHSIRVRET